MYIGVQDRMVYEPQLLHMWAAIMAQTAGEEVILRHGIGSFYVKYNFNADPQLFECLLLLNTIFVH